MKKLVFIGAILLSLTTTKTSFAENYTVLSTEMCDEGPNGYYTIDAFNQGTVTTALGDRVTTRVLLCKNPGPNTCKDPGKIAKENYDDEEVVQQQVSAEIASGNTSGQTFLDGSSGIETVSTFDATTATTPCVIWESSPSENGGTCTKIIVFDREDD
ncbi:MAG: hypothetical protein R2800_08445 [Flavipsychrobacter sp.]